jgi:hypothetical protein
MHARSVRSLLFILGPMLLFLGYPSKACADEVSFGVNVDTSSLVGSPAGPFQIGFVLIDASGLGDANNTVDIANFAFGGGAAGSVDPSASIGGESGDLLSGITLTDSSPLNSFASEFTPGSSLSFMVTMTTNQDASLHPSVGLPGDQFDFFILSGDNPGGSLLPLATTDPTGTDTLAVAQIIPNGVTIQQYQLVTTPEPGSLWLLGCGLVACSLIRRKFAN